MLQSLKVSALYVYFYSKLRDREILDGYLSRALNVQLDTKLVKDTSTNETKYLSVVDDSSYVLTPDYAIKMLDIHERFMCGVPVIIEGETGVGKTALVEMLSKLWNQSLLLEIKKQTDRVIEFLKKSIGAVDSEGLDASTYQVQSLFDTIMSNINLHTFLTGMY